MRAPCNLRCELLRKRPTFYGRIIKIGSLPSKVLLHLVFGGPFTLSLAAGSRVVREGEGEGEGGGVNLPSWRVKRLGRGTV